MIQKQIALLVVSTLISMLGISQRAPGYLGKRLNLGVNFQASPALSNPNINGNSGFFKFNTQFGATIEYATNRHASILAHYQTYTTKKGYGNLQQLMAQSYGYSSATFYGHLKATSFGFEYRIYSGSIAPQGFYTGVGLNYKKIDLTQPAFFSLPTTPLIGGTSLVPKNESPYSLLSFGISMGKQRIYFNRLIISTGVNFMIPLEIGKLGLFENPSNGYFYKESVEIYKRIASHDLVNFKIGARLLIF
jgi:hypothetical protein